MANKKKLIEVALPLEAINTASVKEKSIRQGHPSTLHLWWARRPLAAARAVIFAQMVDDPSAQPDLFPTEKQQEKERRRLFRIIEDLVEWENTNNEVVLQKARDEIWQSWRASCAENASDPRAMQLYDRHRLPAFHDPFAGGGALPLEAHRLGLESHAGDLNPVAVLICKAMIEIPPKFAGKPPVNPDARKAKTLLAGEWIGARALAEDVRYYGQWMRDEAQTRIGHLYPKVEVTAEMTKARPDLKPLMGQKLTVIAWLWARTVRSPNPAVPNVEVPLASSFVLSAKPGSEAYVQPIVENGGYRFTVNAGRPKDSELTQSGTKLARGANFRCLMSGVPIAPDYIKAEGRAGRIGARMMAIVAEGVSSRVYLSPTPEMEAVAHAARPGWKPDLLISGSTQYLGVKPYGMEKFSQLFTDRQLVALTTFSDLVQDARVRIERDATAAGMSGEEGALVSGGNGAKAYADTVATYLSIALSRLVDMCNALCRWEVTKTQVRNLFGRQAIPMLWDFAENNVLGEAGGAYLVSLSNMAKALDQLPASHAGFAEQADAQSQLSSQGRVVSTDPPYYDNVPYADLSDFFYVWLRRSLNGIFPDLFSTVATPKAEELVAFAYRHGDKRRAEQFFLDGMTKAMHRLAEQAHPAFPVTIYYAFKQAEGEEGGVVSTGWETFLDAVIRAGFDITGTWPMRTELRNRIRGMDSNALASSIVLVCRSRLAAGPTATRREFISALKAELPAALANLQRGNIAPVDLAQAAIGPGMAVYTRYAKVVDAAGNPLPVREALALINQTLDEALAEQEGDFDADSRWAVAWFGDHGFADGPFGDAEGYFRRFNTAENALVRIIRSGRSRVRLLKPSELPGNWDPSSSRLTAWEMVHQLIRSLESGGEEAAARLAGKLGAKAEIARELAYRLYTLSERKKRAQEALAYNSLVQSWPEITRLAREDGRPRMEQKGLFDAEEGE